MRRLAATLSVLTIFAPFGLPAEAETLSPVKIAELSARLYTTGVEMADPVLILSAAKLRKSINPTKGTLLPEGATVASDEVPLGWEEMLATAETLAEGDDTLLGLVDDVRAEAAKGVAAGPVYNIGNLGNGAADTYPSVEFVGGEYAEIYVEARAATDLNLEVFDAKGRLVCSDTDKSHIAYCGWRPADNGGFVMKVQNRGPAGGSYALMTN